jgi:hypothetical protein
MPGVPLPYLLMQSVHSIWLRSGLRLQSIPFEWFRGKVFKRIEFAADGEELPRRIEVFSTNYFSELRVSALPRGSGFICVV